MVLSASLGALKSRLDDFFKKMLLLKHKFSRYIQEPLAEILFPVMQEGPTMLVMVPSGHKNL